MEYSPRHSCKLVCECTNLDQKGVETTLHNYAQCVPGTITNSDGQLGCECASGTIAKKVAGGWWECLPNS